VAYLPGLAMRRIADLYPGRAKTNTRDTFNTADTAPSLPHTLRPVDLGDDALGDR
jgi:Transposase